MTTIAAAAAATGALLSFDLALRYSKWYLLPVGRLGKGPFFFGPREAGEDMTKGHSIFIY